MAGKDLILIIKAGILFSDGRGHTAFSSNIL